MNKLNLLLSLTLCFYTLSSCTKSYTADSTTSVAIAGEYWVQIDSVSGDAAANFSSFPQNYKTLSIYNTADNNNDVWLSFPQFKVLAKVQADIPNNALTTKADVTFNNYLDTTNEVNPFNINTDIATLGISPPSGSLVLLQNSTILKNGFTSLVSYATSDSIYLVLTFPKSIYTGLNTKKYKIGGYRRTRWKEDDH